MVIDVETSNLDELVWVLDAASEVHSCEVLRTDQRRVMLQLKIKEHEPRIAARTAGMLPRYPMILREGWQTIETVLSWERLSQLKAEFEREDMSFEVLSVTQPVEVTGLLTDRQWKVFTVAIVREYYDSPRGRTLNELATVLDVNPSAVSGVLYRAKEQITKAFVAETKHLIY